MYLNISLGPSHLFRSSGIAKFITLIIGLIDSKGVC